MWWDQFDGLRMKYEGGELRKSGKITVFQPFNLIKSYLIIAFDTTNFDQNLEDHHNSFLCYESTWVHWCFEAVNYEIFAKIKKYRSSLIQLWYNNCWFIWIDGSKTWENIYSDRIYKFWYQFPAIGYTFWRVDYEMMI